MILRGAWLGLAFMLSTQLLCGAGEVDLGRPVKLFRLVNAGPVGVLKALMLGLGVRASIELTEDREARGTGLPNIQAEDCLPTVSFFARGINLRELLDSLSAIDTRYRWRASGDFIHFLPRGVERSKSHVMNSFVKAVNYQNVDPYELLDELDRSIGKEAGVRFTWACGLPPQVRIVGDMKLAGPVSLSFDGGTLRSLADAISLAQPNGYWFFISRGMLKRIDKGGTYDRDWLVFCNKPAFRGVPTGKLLDELRAIDPEHLESNRLRDIIVELEARAFEDVDPLIDAYWNPANESSPFLRAFLLDAVATVQSEKVEVFLLQALKSVKEDEPGLVEAVGNAVSSTHPMEEAIPRLEALASSPTASARVRDSSKVYVRILKAEFRGEK